MLSQGIEVLPDRYAVAMLVGAIILGRGRRFITDWSPFIGLLISYDFLRGFADDLAGRGIPPADASGHGDIRHRPDGIPATDFLQLELAPVVRLRCDPPVFPAFRPPAGIRDAPVAPQPEPIHRVRGQPDCSVVWRLAHLPRLPFGP